MGTVVGATVMIHSGQGDRFLPSGRETHHAQSITILHKMFEHRLQLKLRLLLVFTLVMLTSFASAQVGDFRNDLSIGINGGYQLNSIAFVPKVPQGMKGGVNIGLSARYVCEKYFNTICAVQMEINYAQSGWKEQILSKNDEPCISTITGEQLRYEREISYLQLPLLAHLGWGREVSGAKFFLNLGPQFGLALSESTKTNFTTDEAFYTEPSRASSVIAQDTMAVEHKFDYGITAGVGMEYSIPKVGHIQLETRYYYGLGNIYKDSKADFFSRSNHNSIVFKLTYLFDIIRTRNCQRR